MSEILWIVAGVAIFLFAKKVYTLGTEVKEAEAMLKERLNQIIHIVKQEQEGDMYYWYDQDSDQFLAQGRTPTEIISVLKERWKDHIFVINEKEMLVGPEFEVHQI